MNLHRHHQSSDRAKDDTRILPDSQGIFETTTGLLLVEVIRNQDKNENNLVFN